MKHLPTFQDLVAADSRAEGGASSSSDNKAIWLIKAFVFFKEVNFREGEAPAEPRGRSRFPWLAARQWPRPPDAISIK